MQILNPTFLFWDSSSVALQDLQFQNNHYLSNHPHLKKASFPLPLSLLLLIGYILITRVNQLNRAGLLFSQPEQCV